MATTASKLSAPPLETLPGDDVYSPSERTNLLAEQEMALFTQPPPLPATSAVADADGPVPPPTSVHEELPACSPPPYSPIDVAGQPLPVWQEGLREHQNPTPNCRWQWVCCSCFFWLVSLIFIIGLPVADTLSCNALFDAGVSSLVVGCWVFLMGCLCCGCAYSKRFESRRMYAFYWCLVSVGLLGFMALAAWNGALVFSVDVFNNSYSPRCDGPIALPFGLAILSYFLLALFFVFCCISTCLCYKGLGDDFQY